MYYLTGIVSLQILILQTQCKTSRAVYLLVIGKLPASSPAVHQSPISNSSHMCIQHPTASCEGQVIKKIPKLTNMKDLLYFLDMEYYPNKYFLQLVKLGDRLVWAHQEECSLCVRPEHTQVVNTTGHEITNELILKYYDPQQTFHITDWCQLEMFWSSLAAKGTSHVTTKNLQPY